VTTVLGYDAVDVAAMPAGGAFYLGYIDGGYVTYPAVKARFPSAQVLTVTTSGRNKARICDVESGDATPAIFAQGVRGGLYRTAYSDMSTYDALVAACGGLSWDWFAADPTGTEHIPAKAVACQWAWGQLGQVPGNYDADVAYTSWLNPTPQPAPSQGGSTMTCDVPGGGVLVARPDGAVDTYDGAQFYGSLSGRPLSAPIVGICATPTGHGYWMVGADAAVYAFGDAQYYGPVPKYPAAWGLGVGHAIPVVGIVRGTAPGVAYTIVGDNLGSPQASLYGITTNGQYKS
jgi:hypothetical protein